MEIKIICNGSKNKIKTISKEKIKHLICINRCTIDNKRYKTNLKKERFNIIMIPYLKINKKLCMQPEIYQDIIVIKKLNNNISRDKGKN